MKKRKQMNWKMFYIIISFIGMIFTAWGIIGIIWGNPIDLFIHKPNIIEENITEECQN